MIHHAGEALTSVVATERLYVLTLGSQQGNRHVHWHLVTLPPGVPYDDQQIGFFDERRGYLQFDAADMAELAASITRAM